MAAEQIIVVDNASRDGTSAVVTRMQAGSPERFPYYVDRCQRNDSAHRTTSPILLAAKIILRSLYWRLKLFELPGLPWTPLRAATPLDPAADHPVVPRTGVAFAVGRRGPSMPRGGLRCRR